MSGKLNTKENRKKASNAIMMRFFKLQDACRSLTAKEVETLLKDLKDRRDSKEKIKPKKPVLKFIETKLDENQVPVKGETKEIILSYADIDRLNSILEGKISDEKKVKEQGVTNKTI